jgi:hypothetical protein
MRRDVLRSAGWFLTEWKGGAVMAMEGGGGGVVVGEKAAREKEMERLQLCDQRKDPTLCAVSFSCLCGGGDAGFLLSGFRGCGAAGSFDGKHAGFFKRTGEVRTYHGTPPLAI